jgi:hypothetical protein
MFAAYYILVGGTIRLLIAIGIFYVLSLAIYSSEPLCNSVMELLPTRCSTTGTAEPFLISALINKFYL